jgi:KaiC/GvpD/RAD55 family RecA-like ATPase
MSAAKASNDQGEARPRYTPLADRVLRTDKATAVPVATGIPALDAACRGGFRKVDVVIIGAPTSVGKTTLAVQLGLKWAQDGCRVAILACDEDADGLAGRLAQGLGFSKTAFESGDLATRRSLADRVAGLTNLALIDDFEDELTIEDAAEVLFRLPGHGQPILVVDSIQTACAKGAGRVEGAQARADIVCAALKRVAREGAIVVATSELARPPKSRGVAVDDLNAFKWSGAIEHAAKKALVLRKDGDVVTVNVCKNRGFSLTSFALRLDSDTATFEEVATAAANDTYVSPYPARIRVALTAHPGVSTAKLRTLVGGNKVDRDASIAEMKRVGEIRTEGKGKKTKLFLADPSLSLPIPSPSLKEGSVLPFPTHPQPLKGGVEGGGAEKSWWSNDLQDQSQWRP